MILRRLAVLWVYLYQKEIVLIKGSLYYEPR
jgi:hypothetical protein